MPERKSRPRVLGRHLGGTGGACLQQVSVVLPGEFLAGEEMYTELILVVPYSSSQMQASSPFGKFIYQSENKELIADLLITLAGQIRREGK